MAKGGRRPGAGAPRGNLNALRYGRRSNQIHQAIENALQDPKGRAQLITLVRRYQGTEC